MRTTLIVAILAIFALPSTGAAENPDAQRHFERALEHFQAERYRAAADAFWRAYNLDPRNDILFGLAQSKRLDGRCKSAVRYYRKLLRRNLPSSDRRAVIEGMSLCGVDTKSEGFDDTNAEEAEEVVEKDRPEPAAASRRSAESDARATSRVEDSEDEDMEEEPEDEEGDERPAPARDSDSDTARTSKTKSPWYTDPIGDALLVSGIIGLGVGTGYFLVSSSDRDAAKSASNYETHRTLNDRAQSRRTIAILATSASAALLTGAIVRFVTRDNDSDGHEETTAVAWGSSNEVGIAIGGSF